MQEQGRLRQRSFGVGKPCATQFQLLAQRVNFTLHVRCALQQASHLMPVRVTQISVGHRQFVNFSERDVEVNPIV